MRSTKGNRRKSYAFLLSFFVFCAFLLPFGQGCKSTENEKNVRVEKEEDTINIGMSFDSFVIERWQRDRDVFVSTAKEMGAEVNVQNANGDIEEQKKQILYLIEQDVDVIVIICIDADSLKEEVQKAKNAGIKVIAYDRIIRDADIDLYISFDNEEVGRQMGEAMVNDGLKEGDNVIIIGGSPADYNVPMVEKGFTDVMQANGISISDTIHCDGWDAELATEYIYSNPDTVAQADAIMCGNDNIASRVVSALSEQRLAGKVKVTGQDADLEACQKIVEGTQLMTVYKPVDLLAKRAAEYAISFAKGENIGETSFINDGTYDVKYVSLAPISVTKEDMEEVIIKNGFHSREDVYLNIPNRQE